MKKKRIIFRNLLVIMLILTALHVFSYKAEAAETVSPVKVTGVRQTRWLNNKKIVQVMWDKQKVAGYEYVFMDNTGKELSKGFTYKNYYEHSVSNKKYYLIKVRAMASVNGKLQTGEYSDTVCLLAQPMIKSSNYGSTYKISVSQGKLNLKWGKVGTASGYRVYVSKKRDSGYKLVATVNKKSKTSISVKKFGSKKYKTNGKYYIYVQSIKKYGSNICTSGVNYVWEYKKGKITKTAYYGTY